MFLVDTRAGPDHRRRRAEARRSPASSRTAQWLQRQPRRRWTTCPRPPSPHEPDHETVLQRQQAFGYTTEDLQASCWRRWPATATRRRLDGQRHAAGRALGPAAAALQLLQAALRPGHQPAGGLHPRRDHHVDGDDHRPRGQPARADAASRPGRSSCDRRSCATRSWTSCVTWTATTARHGFKSITLPILFPRQGRRRGPASGRSTTLCRQASEAIADGHDIIILSDRGIDARPRADPGPAGRRRRAPPPDPRGHAHAGRPGAGERRAARGAPLRPADRLRRRRDQPVPGVRDARRHDPPGHAAPASTTRRPVKNYVKAVDKGVVKVMSKMGISTVQSYCGAQIFEAIGLDQDVIDKYFTWTPSRVGGIGLDVIAAEVAGAPRRAPSPTGRCQRPDARRGGQYQYRQRGRVPPVQPGDGPQAAARLPHRQLQGLQGVQRAGRQPGEAAVHAARPDGASSPAGRRRCRSRRSSRSRRS